MSYLTNRLTRLTIKPCIARLSFNKLPQTQYDLLLRRGYNVVCDPKLFGVLLAQHKPVYFTGAYGMQTRNAALDISSMDNNNPLIMLIDDVTSHPLGDYNNLKQHLRKLACGNAVGLYFALVTNRNLPGGITSECDVFDI